MKTLALSLVAACLVLLCACAAERPAFHALERPPDGMAVIYLYRLPNDWKTEFKISADGRPIGRITPGTCLTHVAPPGRVTLSSLAVWKLFSGGLLNHAVAGTSTYAIDVIAGRTYYLLGTTLRPEPLAFNIENLRLHVHETAEADARLVLPMLKEADAGEAGAAP